MIERTTDRAPDHVGLLVSSALLIGLILSVSGVAFAQAWVAPARVGAVNFIYQNIDHTGHILADGSFLPGYESVSRGFLVEVDYAVTNRFSVRAGVPYIGAKYLGPEPSFFGLEIDDCNCWSTGFQDLSLTARYNVFNKEAFALTPSISYGYPTNDYPYFGEAVIGRNLNELQLAIDLGYRIDAISTKLSISGRYAYAFVDEVLDIPNDRTNAYVGLGYLFTRRFVGYLQFYWQRSHGGLKSDEFVTEEEWVQFDRLLKDNNFHMGGTLSYAFKRFDIFATFTEFVSGTDTHTGRAVTFGLSMPFEL